MSTEVPGPAEPVREPETLETSRPPVEDPSPSAPPDTEPTKQRPANDPPVPDRPTSERL
jgi:hypothetical protein